MTTNNRNDHLLHTAAYLSVINALIIIIVKFYGWLLTDSASILASLIDAFLDISSSFINLIAIRLSIRPPDNEHRFGHEKIQDLAVFAQSMFFAASSVFVFVTSISRLSSVKVLQNSHIGIYAMLISTCLTLVVVSYQTYVIRQTNFSIIKADRLHYISDILTNLAVISSIYLSELFGFIYADPIFAMLIALYILHGAYQLSTSAIKNLVDQEFSTDDRLRIVKIISDNEMIKGIHELKTRYAGNKPFIQCHLELDGNITLYQAHNITDAIMEQLQQAFPGSEVIIHQDPAGHEENVEFQEILTRSQPN